jgi:hypothetical protein
MSPGSLTRPRSSRRSRCRPRRPALEGFNVLFDFPVDVGMARQLLVESGEALLRLRTVGLDVGPEIVDLPINLRVQFGDRIEHVFQRGLDHRLQGIGAHRERARKLGSLALLNHVDGEKRYVITPEGMLVGDTVITSKNAERGARRVRSADGGRGGTRQDRGRRRLCAPRSRTSSSIRSLL